MVNTSTNAAVREVATRLLRDINKNNLKMPLSIHEVLLIGEEGRTNNTGVLSSIMLSTRADRTLSLSQAVEQFFGSELALFSFNSLVQSWCQKHCPPLDTLPTLLIRGFRINDSSAGDEYDGVTLLDFLTETYEDGLKKLKEYEDCLKIDLGVRTPGNLLHQFKLVIDTLEYIIVCLKNHYHSVYKDNGVLLNLLWAFQNQLELKVCSDEYHLPRIEI